MKDKLLPLLVSLLQSSLAQGKDSNERKWH